MSRRASSNRGRRMRGGTTANPGDPGVNPVTFDRARKALKKGEEALKKGEEYGTRVKQLKADNPTIVTIIIFICSIVVALSIPGMYYWKPEWYFVVPVALVICILAGWVYYGKKEVGASKKKISKFLGGSLGIGLVIFLLLRVSSSIGIGDGMFKKGWFDNNYCDEIKEEDT